MLVDMSEWSHLTQSIRFRCICYYINKEEFRCWSDPYDDLRPDVQMVPCKISQVDLDQSDYSIGVMPQNGIWITFYTPTPFAWYSAPLLGKMNRERDATRVRRVRLLALWATQWLMLRTNPVKSKITRRLWRRKEFIGNCHSTQEISSADRTLQQVKSGRLLEDFFNAKWAIISIWSSTLRFHAANRYGARQDKIVITLITLVKELKSTSCVIFAIRVSCWRGVHSKCADDF